MVTFDTLNFTENTMIDESIEKFEYHKYQSRITNFDNPATEISIIINQEGLFTLPSDAYILIEGRLLKADGTSYANADAVTLVNNGLMYLFSRADFQLSGKIVENIKNLGRTTTMIGLLKYSNAFQFVQGMNQLCDTYDKVVCGLTHTLTLIRDDNNKAIFRAANAAAGQINLTKVSLFMPHVKPSLEYKLKLNKEVESKSLSVSFNERHSEFLSVSQTTDFTCSLNPTSYSARPRFIVVGFQTNKNISQEQNPATFDHCDLKNMYVTLNSRSYSEIVNYNLSLPDQQFSRAYRDASLFTKKVLWNE
ncbi:uncharacterized protein LOC124816143 [Hydra vulgaris]|uniref:uncharacterized protein LOC124816143 n=1 Tax=Hydra vulgaris TaxID=6087 RepID=UPI001F5E5692|nr:uncharacterized protein LOC124816143 [Hydra vulgaris]